MSLDLDERQRAMLQELGVRVWLPQAGAAAPSLFAGAGNEVPAVGNAAREPAAIAIEAAAVNAVKARPVAPGVPSVPLPDPADPASAALAEGIADMDWPMLAKTVAACQACLLCRGRRAPVLAAARAPQQADWLVVGEPPDETEERLGMPFAGQAGQLLDNMLKALGVRRSEADGDGGGAGVAYVTNVVKCRPARAHNPGPAELATCENFLRREVALVQPKVILAMGRFAAQGLLQGQLPEVASIPLGKLRGQIYRYQGIPLVVTYPPVYLLRTQQDKARAWADLCLALDVLRRGESAPAG